MKTIFPLLLLSCLWACSGKTDSPPEQQPVVADTVVVKSSDTLQIGQLLCHIEDLQDTNYVFAQEQVPDSSDHANIIRYPGLISRKGDTLFLKCDNGKTVRLIDHRSDGDDYHTFYFSGYYEKIHTYVIFLSLYEGSSWQWIDKGSGELMTTISAPVVSPDCNHIVAVNFNLMGAYDVNGVELFAKTQNWYKSAGLRELYDWGPDKVLWKNDSTLIIRAQAVSDNNGDNNFKTVYKALTIGE